MITATIRGKTFKPLEDEKYKTETFRQETSSLIEYPGHIILDNTKILGHIFLGGTLTAHNSIFQTVQAGGSIILYMIRGHDITAKGSITAVSTIVTSLKAVICAVDVINIQADFICSMGSYVKVQCCEKPIKRIEAKKFIEIDNCTNIGTAITEGPAFITDSKINKLICAIEPSKALVIKNSQIGTIHLYSLIEFFKPYEKPAQFIELHNSVVKNVMFSEAAGTVMFSGNSEVTGEVTYGIT